MVRRRIKHKQVVETIQQDDLQVFKTKMSEFWQTWVRPYENYVWTGLLVVVVVVGGSMWWRNHRSARISDANLYLAEAQTFFASGETDSAMEQLEYILPGGNYQDPGIVVPAQLLQAKIAYASGEYQAATDILQKALNRAPSGMHTELQYLMALCQANTGNLEEALATLDKIKPKLGAEPDYTDSERKISPWDRYHYLQGRFLALSGKKDQAEQSFLRIAPESPWRNEAQREIGWLIAQPVGAISAN